MSSPTLSVLPGPASLGVHGAPSCAPQEVAPELTPTELLGVAHGLAVQHDLWHPHVRHDPLQRTYHEVAREERFSAWLICWMPGHDTGFHDHDGAGGVGLVLRVREARLAVGAAPVAREIGRGQHFSFSAHDIHRVEHAGDEPAVTLHVYSPVLVRMGAYEVAPNGTLRRHTLDESEELRPWSGARTLRSVR
jgi:Cysteine dioxygenase type I